MCWPNVAMLIANLRKNKQKQTKKPTFHRNQTRLSASYHKIKKYPRYS